MERIFQSDSYFGDEVIYFLFLYITRTYEAASMCPQISLEDDPILLYFEEICAKEENDVTPTPTSMAHQVNIAVRILAHNEPKRLKCVQRYTTKKCYLVTFSGHFDNIAYNIFYRMKYTRTIMITEFPSQIDRICFFLILLVQKTGKL
ncbi:hypothetical protein ACJX0J_038034, partial [Zea mays]